MNSDILNVVGSPLQLFLFPWETVHNPSPVPVSTGARHGTPSTRESNQTTHEHSTLEASSTSP